MCTFDRQSGNCYGWHASRPTAGTEEPDQREFRGGKAVKASVKWRHALSTEADVDMSAVRAGEGRLPCRPANLARQGTLTVHSVTRKTPVLNQARLLPSINVRSNAHFVNATLVPNRWIINPPADLRLRTFFTDDHTGDVDRRPQERDPGGGGPRAGYQRAAGQPDSHWLLTCTQSPSTPSVRAKHLIDPARFN